MKRVRNVARLDAGVHATVAACIPCGTKVMRQRVNDRHIATNRILKTSLRRDQVKPEGACVAIDTVTHDARTACEVIAKGSEIEGCNDLELGAQKAGFVEARSQRGGHESTLFSPVCPTALVLSCRAAPR